MSGSIFLGRGCPGEAALWRTVRMGGIILGELSAWGVLSGGNCTGGTVRGNLPVTETNV